MIYIVHGDDIAKSRVLLNNQQKKMGVDSKVELDITQISPQELFETISQKDIFGFSPFLVLDISSAGRTNLDKHIEILKGLPKDTNVVVLSDKSLSKSNVFIKKSSELGAKIIESTVKPEGNVFRFVDAVFYKNRNQAYKELESLLSTQEDAFRLFAMLLYGLRSLLHAKLASSQFAKLKPFQQSKLIKQRELYEIETIKSFFFSFYDLEKKAKTGEITPDVMVTRAVEKVLNS